MKAIMYGGGNIGRGFIGALFSRSGYQVTFIDVAKPVVEALHIRGNYPVRILSDEGFRDETVEHVDAIDGNDAAAVIQAIAGADIMATAVGANILKFIVPNIAAGLKRRFEQTEDPLNIIICENLMDANKVVERMLKEQMTPEEQRLLDERVGLVEASIGRMVPVQTPEMQEGDPLRVCVERYGYLPVDRDAFRGEIPAIGSMVPFSPFDFYIRRKLYIHNLGHATTAYLGLYAKRTYIFEAIDDADTYAIALNAMLESAEALAKKYAVPLDGILRHIQDLLFRFTNRALKDTCARVGADLKRKLAPQDRLIGSATLCLEQGVTPAFLCVGAAGAVYEYLRQSGAEQTRKNAEETLKTLSHLAEGSLFDQILAYYALFAAGEPIANIRRAAQKTKAEHNQDVV
ncbi:MAG: mannitol dehydrogenase [Christensenella sp.]|nr:mannitol dehydrogenase [Christensenella sp.]